MFSHFLYNKSIFYFFIVFILNGSLLSFDKSFLLLQIFTILILFITLFIDEREEYLFSFTGVKFNSSNILFTLLIVFPISFYFFFNINQEHPFSGDYKLHVESSLNTNQFWLNSVFFNLDLKNIFSYSLSKLFIIFFTSRLAILFLIIAIYFILNYLKKNISYFFLIISLITWSYVDDYFLHYPSGLFFLSLPFNFFTYFLNDLSLMEGLRICNFLSIFIWLFILRPLVIGKNPDLNAFLFSAFLFWKLEIIYLFTSSYIEPYGLVCLFIAIESSLNNKKNCTTAFWLGLSTCFKSMFIFLFPFFWLIEKPWKMNFQTLFKHTLYYILFGIPFLHFYYNTRIIGHVTRTLHIDFNLANGAKIEELFFRILNNYTIIELIIFITLTIIILFKFFSKNLFYKYSLIILSAFTIFTMYFVDKSSELFIGHIRFMIYSLVLLPGLFLYNKIIFKNNFVKIIIFVSFLFIFTINFYKVYTFTFLPDTEKSFLLHYQEPIYLPIKSLVKKFEGKEIIIDKDIIVGVPHEHVRGMQSTFTYKNYNYIFAEPYKLNCTCNSDNIILNTFLPRVNINNNLKEIKFRSQHFLIEAHIDDFLITSSKKDQCILELTLSCKNIEYEYSSKNKIIGVIAKK